MKKTKNVCRTVVRFRDANASAGGLKMAEVAAEIETKFFIVRNLSDESQMQRYVNIFAS